MGNTWTAILNALICAFACIAKLALKGSLLQAERPF